ncbi:hypothetical protein [Streptomyces microflavus]
MSRAVQTDPERGGGERVSVSRMPPGVAPAGEEGVDADADGFRDWTVSTAAVQRSLRFPWKPLRRT